MTQVVYCALIVLLTAASFFSGMKVSDRYHKLARDERELALMKQFARLQTGSDADDPVQPYVSLQAFNECENKLKANGRAVMRINKNRPPQASAKPI